MGDFDELTNKQLQDQLDEAVKLCAKALRSCASSRLAVIAIATILAVLFFRFVRVGTTAERVWRERREELDRADWWKP